MAKIVENGADLLEVFEIALADTTGDKKLRSFFLESVDIFHKNCAAVVISEMANIDHLDKYNYLKLVVASGSVNSANDIIALAIAESKKRMIAAFEAKKSDLLTILSKNV